VLHDRELLDRLAAFAPVRFEGDVYRATRRGLDPLAASIAGGRWMVPNETPTLYTSCERNGALAEISHHWSQLTPLPSKPVMIHTLGLRTRKTLKLGRTDLIDLGVDWKQYANKNPERTQMIGAAVAHLEFDGLIAPSARWRCDNVILFVTNHEGDEDALIVRESVEVDWRNWKQNSTMADDPTS
jgi:RES domain-containing protein